MWGKENISGGPGPLAAYEPSYTYAKWKPLSHKNNHTMKVRRYFHHSTAYGVKFPRVM